MDECNDFPWIGDSSRKYTEAEIAQMPFAVSKVVARSHNRYLDKCEKMLAENCWPREL